MPSIKGTSSVADPRARSKALKSTRFPKNFSLPVQLSKVNKPVLRQWIEQRVTAILGFEDEIVSSTAINLFLPEEGNNPDPRRAQLDLVGFLGEGESASFAKELWGLLLEAQSSGTGIPKTLLEQKKKELEAQRMANQASSNAALKSVSSNRFSASDASQNAHNPEMNQFVQEAARRAQAARQLVNDAHAEQNGPVNAAAAAPAADVVPVSPPPESPDIDPARKMPIENSNKRTDTGGSDRKMTPRERYERSLREGPESNRDQASRGRFGGVDTGRPQRSYGYGSSGYGARDRERRSGGRSMQRSRSRSFERSRGRDYDYRDRESFRGSRQRRRDDRDHYRRYRDEDDEIDDLEQRLSDLKRQSAKRRDNYALDEEIEDVKDRIHELERRRRRRRKERDCGRYDRGEDEYGRKRRRRDSPERNRRRSPSPDKGEASSDDSSRSRSRSTSYDREDREQRKKRGDSEGDRRRDVEDERKRDRSRNDDRDRERNGRRPSSASSGSDRSGSDSD